LDFPSIGYFDPLLTSKNICFCNLGGLIGSFADVVPRHREVNRISECSWREIVLEILKKYTKIKKNNNFKDVSKYFYMKK